MDKKGKETNPELEQLGTHASGATDTFKGRKTAKTVINEPVVPNPGPYDTRTGYYE